MPAPRDTPGTAEERPPCDRILGASPPRTLFPSPHPQQTTQNHSFRAGSKRSWTKRGKYEYCYHFSSRQNHPKWRPCGSARPFQLTRIADLGLGDPLLMNRFLVMFIIFFGRKCYRPGTSTHIWHYLSTHILLTPYNRQNTGRNPWQRPVWSPKEALSAVAHRLQDKHDNRQHRNHGDSRPSEHVPHATVAVGTHNVTVGGDNHLEHQNHGQ